MEFTLHGFYKVKDEYFSDFPSKWHAQNKSENRPYYLAAMSENGIIWLIPISSRVESYRAKIIADEEKYGKCLMYHIIEFMDEERVALIGNMIPVIPKYIKDKFTISENHYIVQNTATKNAIRTRSSRYLSLVRSGKLHPYLDILSIERKLLSSMGKS